MSQANLMKAAPVQVTSRELERCRWCGHDFHADVCPGQIQTGMKDKRPVYAPCPCAKRSKP